MPGMHGGGDTQPNFPRLVFIQPPLTGVATQALPIASRRTVVLPVPWLGRRRFSGANNNAPEQVRILTGAAWRHGG